MTATHEVTNQPGPPAARDAWAADAPLREAAAEAGADAGALAAYGVALAFRVAHWRHGPDEAGARAFAEDTALLLAAALAHGAPPAVAGAYLATRLGPRRQTAGTADPDPAPLVARLAPARPAARPARRGGWAGPASPTARPAPRTGRG